MTQLLDTVAAADDNDDDADDTESESYDIADDFRGIRGSQGSKSIRQFYRRLFGRTVEHRFLILWAPVVLAESATDRLKTVLMSGICAACFIRWMCEVTFVGGPSF